MEDEEVGEGPGRAFVAEGVRWACLSHTTGWNEPIAIGWTRRLKWFQKM